MAQWRRDTPWRQGHILASETVIAVGLDASSSPGGGAFVVVSHDCDLAQEPDIEPKCEIMMGAIVEKEDGNFSWAKNPRRLHLSFTAGNRQIVVDLRAQNKCLIDKTVLADHTPDSNVSLTPSGLGILQSWLAARYRRAAFPNEFEQRLKNGRASVHKELSKILAKTGEHIVAILFDVDRGKEIDRKGADDPYELSIYLLYNVGKDPNIARNVTSYAAREIETIFHKAFFIGDKWQNIELLDVFSISEDAMTVWQSRQLKKWNADHLSLREEPQHPMLDNE